MRILLPLERAVKPPISTSGYFDLVAVWFRDPIDAATLSKLGGACGHLKVTRRPARWARRWGQPYRVRCEFKQPDDAALAWIAGRADACVNRAQFTLDLIYNTPAERDQARQFFHVHLVRRWRRPSPLRFYDNDEDATRYDGPRKCANRLTDYSEPYSRATGEVCCLHVEWTASGVKAVRAAGIITPRDVLRFDHRAFWKRHLRLVTIDLDRLGRALNRRRARITTDRDRFLGRRAFHYGDHTMQGLIDLFGQAWIGRLIEPLPVEPYLVTSRLEVIAVALSGRGPAAERTNQRKEIRCVKTTATTTMGGPPPPGISTRRGTTRA
jgi:hypothetical protein